MGRLEVSTFRQTALLTRTYLKLDWSRKERLFTPVLLSITMLLMFSFALGDFDSSLRFRLFVGECAVTLLFALQVALSRLFEFEQQDRVFDVMRAAAVSPMAVFLAKFSNGFLVCLLIAVPNVFFAGLFAQILTMERFLVFLAVISLGLIGLVALGILLTVMTLLASGRQILYPLLFFPLTTPVLLAMTQAVLELGRDLSGSGAMAIEFTAKAWGWLGLLGAFDAIYFSLALGLVSELLDSDQG